MAARRADEWSLASLNDGSVPLVEARLGTLLSRPHSLAIAQAALTVLADPRFRAREQLGAPALAVGVALLHGASAAAFDAIERHEGLSAEILRWNRLVLEAAARLRRTREPPGKSAGSSPLPRAPRKALHTAWLERANSKSPADLDSLLEVFAIGPATDVTERALALISFPRDERIADAVAALLAKPSVRSDVSVPFFPVLGMTLVAHGSRAHRSHAVALTAAIPTLRWIELLLPDTAPSKPVTPKSKSSAPDSEPGFLAWIADDPNDLARRQLFADWLLENGRPRGEHAALQLAALTRPLTTKEMKRVAALEKKHAPEWLQSLGKGVVRTSTRFSGAVVTRLRVAAWRPAEVPEPDDAQLATLLEFALDGGTNLPLEAFLRTARLSSLNALEIPERLLPEIPAALAQRLTTLSVAARFSSNIPQLLLRLAAMKLPAVETLNLWGRVSTPDFPALAASPLIKRCLTLGLETPDRVEGFEALRSLPGLTSLQLFQSAHLNTLDPGSNWLFTRAPEEAWKLTVFVRPPDSGAKAWMEREVQLAQLDGVSVSFRPLA